MNAPITPIDLSGGYSDLAALLKIIADPATHKAKLDELIGREASAKERIAELHAMEGETRRLNNTAQAANIVCDNRAAALDKRESELDARAQSLEQSEARHRAAFASEEANKREAERLAAMRKDYENKLAQIKNLAGALHH